MKQLKLWFQKNKKIEKTAAVFFHSNQFILPKKKREMFLITL
jgi:hypothetical protein